MKKIKVKVFLFSVLFSIQLQAAERLYKIELLIFSQDMPNSEIFEQIESQIKWPRHVADRASYKKVSSEFLNLSGSVSRLSRSQSYQVLMHIAWTQKVKENRLSTAVRINSPDGSINGFFRIQRGNLVHMITDIEYSPGQYTDSVIYRLNEKRRFKLNETHYLDHPKFGMLARVSPLQKSSE